MTAIESSYNNIAGVPLGYMRNPKRIWQPMTIRSTNELRAALNRFVRDLDAYTRPAGYGTITRMATAGAYVEKPGEHGKGRALDLDRIEWSSGRACTPLDQVHRHPEKWARLRYLALDAVCRQHFRWVLDGHYNAAHHDHIHMDLGGLPVQFSRSSTSEVKFIQAVCREFANTSTVIDGRWGPNSDRDFRHTLQKAGLGNLNPLASSSDYRTFLQRVSQKGFRGQTF